MGFVHDIVVIQASHLNQFNRYTTSDDVIRNLTRNRDLLNGARYYAYKPRFILDESGEIERVPIPELSRDDHLRFIGETSPQLDLEHETFHIGGPAGATALSFPFSVSLIRNLGG